MGGLHLQFALLSVAKAGRGLKPQVSCFSVSFSLEIAHEQADLVSDPTKISAPVVRNDLVY